MLIRRATGEEMLKLWGYSDPDGASPTARFFYQSILSGVAVFWAADNGEELVGELYAFLSIEEDGDFADGERTAYLCAFRVKEGLRGRRLGSRLMETALSELREMGFKRATIGVDDARNERLYRRMGFVTKVKDCRVDPCARDESMRPVEDGDYILLSKEL